MTIFANLCMKLNAKKNVVLRKTLLSLIRNIENGSVHVDTKVDCYDPSYHDGKPYTRLATALSLAAELLDIKSMSILLEKAAEPNITVDGYRQPYNAIQILLYHNLCVTSRLLDFTKLRDSGHEAYDESLVHTNFAGLCLNE